MIYGNLIFKIINGNKLLQIRKKHNKLIQKY